VRLFEVFVGLFDLRIRDLVAPVAKHFEHGLAHSVEYTLFSHLTQHLFLLLITLNKNGVLDKSMLTSPPFNDLDDNGIIGIFPEEEKLIKIIQLIDEVNYNAGLG
jgi:type I restriction enzyme R subunit